jgi:DNA-binding IclR family transcriptional regulator
MWAGLVVKWESELTGAETEAFLLLKTESEKDAFRILRNFQWLSHEKGEADFFVSLYDFASRLGLTPPGAAKLLRRFVDGGILKQTAFAVTYKSSARYAWSISRRSNPELVAPTRGTTP